MRKSLLKLGLCASMAAAFVGVRADIARSESAVNADSYGSPQLNQPANVTTIRIAQTNPPPPGTPAQSAQPGQSTIPPATSTPAQAPPSAGAQPGQSTIPPATSTPGRTQLPPQDGMQAPVQAAPGVLPAPGVVPVPVLPPQQVIVPGQVVPNQVVTPPGQVVVPGGVQQQTSPSPFVEDDAYVEELPIEDEVLRARGVRPYGGGHPSDWSWGCGGSPYRTYGECDDWRVGCDWAVSINGMVMSRDDADLVGLEAQMRATNPDGTIANNVPLLPTTEQFDHGPGARITFMSQVPYHVGYQLQAAYEGIEAWESSIVFPKQDIPPIDVPLPPNYPGGGVLPPDPEGFEQRSLHYRSNYHSGELNWIVGQRSAWKPFLGARYINFDDEINDTYNQEVQPPLPGPGDAIDVGGAGPQDMEFLPIGPTTETDRLNLFDIQNNLMGFQFGILYDNWKLNRRLSMEGFVNSGVYYNKVKYSNIMGIFTTQEFADNTNTPLVDDSRIDFSDAVNVDAREYDEISYHAEASLTGVLRLNRCWALRGGYQCLWIANLQLAEDAYLGAENTTEDLFFHGWHFGVECRR